MVRSALAIVLAAGTALATGNDGWVGQGGNPSLQKGHPTVRMAREVVEIRVGPERTVVEATFTFRNEGPPTQVRIGFPELDSSAMGEETLPAMFLRFDAWVDGRPAAARREFDRETGTGWYVKTVDFAAGQTRTVRNRYVLPNSGGLVTGTVYARYVPYVLHTGASWKGPIGEGTVRITLDPSLPAPTALVPEAALKYRSGQIYAGKGDAEPELNALWKRHLQTVFWSGPSTPTLQGRTITFRFRNLEPTERQNVFLILHPVGPGVGTKMPGG